MTASKNQKFATICIPYPLGTSYDYAIPHEMELEEGSFFTVTFGRQTTTGVVWQTNLDTPSTPDLPREKIKPIAEKIKLAPLPKVSRAFVDWVAKYTVTPQGALLKMVMGGTLRLPKEKDLKEELPDPNPDHKILTLTDSQQKAAETLIESIDENSFKAILLDGVTGSGKTEVYNEAIAAALRANRQVLVLLPEIAMTAGFIDRFTQRFGAPPVLWHSGLTEKQRRLNWNAILTGKAKFVLGARSALFLPFSNLGLIVVDEEHEAAYKQEEGVIYHGRDMAVVRAHMGKIPIILASATPSLETLYNVKTGKYAQVVLKSRFGAARLPTIKLVDLRREKMSAQCFISPPLHTALQECFAAKKQAMLFLNRRGYAPLTLCRGCGYRLQCPDCTSWLIEHKRTNKLHCHHCGHAMPIPIQCPICKAEDRFAACGPGIERIAEEITRTFPDIRMAIMASDTMDDEKAAKDLVTAMHDQELDLLVGTQIMAKGYHFPHLTLVGVIDADLGLSGGDPRAAERTFQLLQQVAGRSGRAEDEGTVYLQTTAPDHPVMKALQKGHRDAFMETEMRERAAYGLPPFCRLASLTIAGADASEVRATAEALARKAPRQEGLKILGPAPAIFAVLRGKTRYRLMIQTTPNAPFTGTALSTLLHQWVSKVKIPRTQRLQIDIDPYSFL